MRQDKKEDKSLKKLSDPGAWGDLCPQCLRVLFLSVIVSLCSSWLQRSTGWISCCPHCLLWSWTTQKPWSCMPKSTCSRCQTSLTRRTAGQSQTLCIRNRNTQWTVVRSGRAHGFINRVSQRQTSCNYPHPGRCVYCPCQHENSWYDYSVCVCVCFQSVE